MTTGITTTIVTTGSTGVSTTARPGVIITERIGTTGDRTIFMIVTLDVTTTGSTAGHGTTTRDTAAAMTVVDPEAVTAKRTPRRSGWPAGPRSSNRLFRFASENR